jgi:hypothetical protein
MLDYLIAASKCSISKQSDVEEKTEQPVEQSQVSEEVSDGEWNVPNPFTQEDAQVEEEGSEEEALTTTKKVKIATKKAKGKTPKSNGTKALVKKGTKKRKSEVLVHL